MNWDLLLAVIFYLIILVIFFWKREKFTVQSKIFIMYRTKLGLNGMDKLAEKYPRLLNWIGYVSITIGFVGMIVILVLLVLETIKLFTTPEAAPGLAPVFPGVQIPGLPSLSFWHWIIVIFILAAVHEFAHGVFARLNKIPVKSSGFAFLGPIPAAFVEPDETVLTQKSRKAQLEVFSAGPFANFAMAVVAFLVTLLILTPLTDASSAPGLPVIEVVDSSPVSTAGLNIGERLIMVNNNSITNVESFQNAVKDIKPGDSVQLITNDSSYTVIAAHRADDTSKGFLGFSILNSTFNSSEHPILTWFNLLFFWLLVLNIGVGMFNLLPLGPVDGGRMFLSAITFFVKKEDVAYKIFMGVSAFVLLLIVVNLIPWFMKLFSFLARPF